MRLNVAFAALLTSTALWESSFADEIDDLDAESSSTSSAAAATTPTINRPKFTPFPVQAPFFEQFTDDWKSRWKVSKAKKVNDKTSNEEWAYIGQWAVEEPTTLKGFDGDKGLVVKNVAAHHAISAKFDKPINNSGKTLVVQYEVKLQNGLECGGAYLKLLKEEAALHAEEFSNASPYVIMFGPDKCGSTNKVHFIFNHKNPLTGKYEEKHLGTAPLMRSVKKSTLYTLIVNSDQTFEIRIDGKKVSDGSLLEKFVPSVNPPEEIDDPDDKKPADWVDESEIPDPDAKKPDDWDEDAPYEIVDESAKKPDDWLDDEPELIPDPEAQKPEDWSDEEDGTWLPPTIANPKCAESSGCGKWEKPLIANPDYKGMWNRPMIANPAWKGIWAPRKIKNPDYFDDASPSNFEPMGGIGFELWTMQNGILFDNIYVGHSIEEAENIQKRTFDVKKKIEDEEDEKVNPKPIDTEPKVESFRENPTGYIKSKLELFFALVQKDPVGAIKTVPEAAGGIIALIVTILAILSSLIGMASAPAKVPKPTPKKEDDKKPSTSVAKEASSSSDEGKPKAARRTTKKAD